MTGQPLGELAVARALLREQCGGEVTDLRPLAGGVFSRAYAGDTGDRHYVLRLSAYDHAAESFAKDDYAWRHFASPALPIPCVVATGRIAGEHFAISERAPGRTLEALAPAARAAALPAVLDALDAIGRADLRASRGYGEWDGTGTGESARWQDYLAAIVEDKTEGFYRGWHRLFHDSFLERDVFEVGYRQMLRLTAACPEDRALIHNDYHFANVLAENGWVTAVIDWGNALYGDPLYDVARLAWWSAQPGWWYDGGAALLHARYGAALRYDQRIACYQCHLGLDDLRYYAKMGQREQYDRVRDRLLALVADAAGTD